MHELFFHCVDLCSDAFVSYRHKAKEIVMVGKKKKHSNYTGSGKYNHLIVFFNFTKVKEYDLWIITLQNTIVLIRYVPFVCLTHW